MIPFESLELQTMCNMQMMYLIINVIIALVDHCGT